MRDPAVPADTQHGWTLRISSVRGNGVQPASRSGRCTMNHVVIDEISFREEVLFTSHGKRDDRRACEILLRSALPLELRGRRPL